MPANVPACPRCDYHDGGGDLCYNSGGTITYRCYECNYLWVADAPETYDGDDARLDAVQGIDTTEDDHNA